MGRQTRIVATEVDELALVHFLRSTGDIRILRSGAPSPQELWCDQLPPYNQLNTHFYFWNAAFAGEPELLTSEGGVCILDLTRAPVIELGRTNAAFELGPRNSCLVGAGRVYWAKHVSVKRLPYNVAKFQKWYESVIRWVRKNGRRAKDVASAPYLLPDSWERWEELRARK